MEPERRYALDALLDALGLPFDEAAPATPNELDEVFRDVQRLREGTAFLLDAFARRDPAFRLDRMGPRSTCFFLARQDDPHDGYPKRYQPALARSIQRAAEDGREIGLHGSYQARK